MPSVSTYADTIAPQSHQLASVAKEYSAYVFGLVARIDVDQVEAWHWVTRSFLPAREFHAPMSQASALHSY
jgi:hypothetical protein